MGISRDRRHKHRKTGGRFPIHQKKRKYELGRPAAVTKLGSKRVRPVRCRGGNIKHRAIRLDTGNYCWASQSESQAYQLVSHSFFSFFSFFCSFPAFLSAVYSCKMRVIFSIDTTDFSSGCSTRCGRIYMHALALIPCMHAFMLASF